MPTRGRATAAEVLGRQAPVLPHRLSHAEEVLSLDMQYADWEEAKSVFHDCARRGAWREYSDFLAKKIMEVGMRLDRARSVEAVLPCRDQYR